MKKKILILTADAGFGHRRAAEAIEASFHLRYSEDTQIQIVNPLHDPALPQLIQSIESDYDEIVVDDPALYQLAYIATDAPVVARLMQELTTTVLNKTLTNLIERQKPDAVITTYPAYSQAIIRARDNVKKSIPVNVVITDLIGVHSVWFHKDVDLTFVPTGNVYKQAVDHELPKSRVHLSGLPVHPNFADEVRTQSEIRKGLGWNPDLRTALVVGSSRTRQTMAIARLLDQSGLPIQIAVVAGGDKQTEEKLHKVDWKENVHVYGMVHNMPELMHAADFVICKAGGLIVTESLACGLALILYEALPGQEEGNVRYVTESGAGVWSPGSIGVLTTVYAWLAGDNSELKQARAAAKHIGKPNAAYEIANRVWRQIQ